MLQAAFPVDCVVEDDQTALMSAALHKRTDVVGLLLQKGADVNIRDGYGDTSVHCAANGNSPEAIAMLVQHGASIDNMNYKGDKPIDSARWYGCEAAVRMLEQL